MFSCGQHILTVSSSRDDLCSRACIPDTDVGALFFLLLAADLANAAPLCSALAHQKATAESQPSSPPLALPDYGSAGAAAGTVNGATAAMAGGGVSSGGVEEHRARRRRVAALWASAGPSETVGAAAAFPAAERGGGGGGSSRRGGGGRGGRGDCRERSVGRTVAAAVAGAVAVLFRQTNAVGALLCAAGRLS